MRLFYIANARIPTEKAHGYQIIKTVEALASAGAEVSLLLPARQNNIDKNLWDFYGIKPVFKVIYAPDFLFWFERLWPKAYFILQRFFFAAYALAYGLLTQADCFYSREITICFLLSFFKKNVVFEDHEPKKTFHRLYGFFLQKISKKIIVAGNLKQIYRRLGVRQDSYLAVPNGVDLAEFNSVAPDRSVWAAEFGLSGYDKIVLYTGHFYDWKGVDTLIESAKFLDQPIKLVMLGGLLADRPKIEKKITGLKLKNVFVHDFLEHSRLIKFIKSADILVLPNTAKEERSFRYTTPIKLFEALASNVPLIASDLESFKDYLADGRNAILFQPDNPSDLAEKINYLIANPAVGQRIAGQAFSQAGQYSWDARAEKILKFIWGK